MTLHEDKKSFPELISLTSQELGIEEIYVEKDYFVVLALKSLSHSKLKKNGIFKGGTSLSKAYGVINRFSEDIDMAVVSDDGEDRGPKSKLKKVENALTSHSVFTYIAEHEREKKSGWLRQTVYEYPIIKDGEDFGQASKHIFVDVSRISPGIPHEERIVQTYIHNFLIRSGQHNVIDEYDLHPFKVSTLSIERTFAEKFGTVVKFASQSDGDGTEPIQRLKDGIRHIYDLHMLLKVNRIRDLVYGKTKLQDLIFNQFLEKVLQDDLAGMRGNKGYEQYMNGSFANCLLYENPSQIWAELNPTFNDVFKRLHFKEPKLPTSEEIIASLEELKSLCQEFDQWKFENNIIFKNSLEE